MSHEVNHERRDVSVTAISLFLAFLMISLLLICIVGYFMHKGFQWWEAPPKSQRLSPVADFNRQAPEPRLEENAAANLQALREREEPLLTTYRWIDGEKGVVQLPIERAKELIAERGLPARKEGPK